MKTRFDKIYVISLTTNKLRQEFIKHQFYELELDFDFIYGTDFKNIKYNYNNEQINYPAMFLNDNLIPGSFGCSISHYQAVLQSYEFNYNNVLIIEDDICFIKNKKLIEKYFNNIPEDADFITWDPRFIYENEYNLIYNELKKSKDLWINLSPNIEGLIGGMIYGIMNRNTMELYLNSQRNNLTISDSIHGIFRYPKPNIKRYIATKCIATDQYNIMENFNTNLFYKCIYQKINNKINITSFYNPNLYLLFTR